MRNSKKIWSLLALGSFFLFVGASSFLVVESNSISYLSDDPKACINCHIMQPQYISWQKSSHARVATCNDCHLPHDNIVRKYMFKAMDGTKHASMFTLRMEPQSIRIAAMGETVVNNNCIRCHGNLFTAPESAHSGMLENKDERTCWECHRDVPHGKERSITSSKDGLIDSKKVQADWMKKYLKRDEK
jgi:cytochrome c nitrite reductase small subunit